MISAGQLNKRVTLQRATEAAADSYNVTALTWGDVKTLWARVRPLTGRELFDSAQMEAEVSHEITFRWVDNVTPKDRISFNGRVFNIVSVINVDEQGTEARCLCVEEI